MAGFSKIVRFSTGGAPTASNGVLINTIDIRDLDRFVVYFKNSASNVNFADLKIETAADPTTANTASFEGQNWVQIPTATLPQPSALAQMTTVVTGPINNAYSFIRVVGRTDISSTQSVLELQITGFKR